MNLPLRLLLAALLAGAALAEAKLKLKLKPDAEPSPLDRYIAEATAGSGVLSPGASPGSLYMPGSWLADAGKDMRAQSVDDLVTILVSDRASAVAQGVTNTTRKSSTAQNVTSLFGATSAAGPLANLAGISGNTQIQGQGQTSRTTTLSTTLTARVTHVLPNGNLVVLGVKEVVVNSERQLVEVRGVVRPIDLTGGNQIASDRVGMLQVRVNGRGVIGDAVRRPFFLYRVLLGFLSL